MFTKKYKQTLGAWGEALAEKYFHQLGWQTLAKNYRTPYGEVDLLLTKNEQVLLVEVKTRHGQKYGWAEECINQKKLEHLQNACYLAQKKFNISQQIFIEIFIIEIHEKKVSIRRFSP